MNNEPAINALKEHRSHLRAIIPAIKHTVRQKQAKKKERRLDYLIGRMVFFNEDFGTARHKTAAKIKRKEI